MEAFVVGIAGGSAAGKTTLMESLRPELERSGRRIGTLALDAYFHTDLEKAPQVTHPSGKVWFHHNHPETADVARFVVDARKAREEFDILVLEGHFVLVREEIRKMLDLAVFVDLDPELRAVRRIIRDVRWGGEKPDLEHIKNHYLLSVRPGHETWVTPSKQHADLIVRGDADPARSSRVLAATILSLANP